MTRYKPFVFLLFLLLLAAGGCSKDGIFQTAGAGAVDMGLTLSTYATDDANAVAQETAVSSAYVFIFNADGLLENPGKTQVRPGGDGSVVDASGRLTGTWRVAAGRKSIYVVLNPHEVQTRSGAAASLADDVTSIAGLETFVTAPDAYATHYAPEAWTGGSLCMSGSATVDVSPETPEVVMSVTRRYARVDLRIKKGAGLENTQMKVTRVVLRDFASQTPLVAAEAPWSGSAVGSELSRTFDNGGVPVTSTSSYTDIALPAAYMMPLPLTASGDRPQLDIYMENPTGEECTTIHFAQLDAEGEFDLSQPLPIEANKIYRVEATIGQRTTASVGVLDWSDTELDADLSHTTLAVDKTSCTLMQTDTLFVSSNAPSIAVTSEADWLTLSRVEQATGRWAVRMDASLDDFTEPRTTRVTVTAGNLVKQISVTQKSIEGTIAWSLDSLFLSPVNNTKRAAVLSSRSWTLVDPPAAAAPSRSAGPAGETAVSFYRNTTVASYGNGLFIAQNDATHDRDTLVVCNLFMDVPNELQLDNKKNDDGSPLENVYDVAIIHGGSERFVVVSYPDWVRSATIDTDNKLTLIYEAEPDEEPRTGIMRVAHADDPEYVLDITLVQDIHIRIPEFDFFTLKFTWDANDVDIAVRFAGNGAAFDDKPVGWSPNTANKITSNVVTYNGANLLQWGGDATAGQGETAFFNAPLINADETLPRQVMLEIYATWYTFDRAPSPMTFHTYAYLGGTMQKNGTNFDNNGGSLVYESSESVMITTTRGIDSYATGGYTKVATLTYDRVKHDASVTIHAQIVTAATAATSLPTSADRAAVADEEPKPVYPYRVIDTYSPAYER